MSIQVGDKIFYSVNELSAKMNLTTTSIRLYLKKGKLKGMKTMGRWFILENSTIQTFNGGSK